MTKVGPKLFISYSWTSSAHEEWVISLATELRESRVDVILDKWDLKEGQDAHAFMEKMVTDPEIKKVAMICDRAYAEKANGRSGGVGTETQIMSAEIYAKQEQTKFVAVLPERDDEGKPFLPAYYRSRVYIDLSNPELYRKNFEQLLRWIYDKPLYVKPELGEQPAFLAASATISLQTTVQYRRALDAVRENKAYCRGALGEYFEAFGKNLECFRIVKDAEEFDDKVVRNIDQFLPYRNEVIDLFMALAQYRANQESWDLMHNCFERLLPYLQPPASVNSWKEEDCDNFKFIVHELFLYAVAVLVRIGCFSGVTHLVRQHYYVEENALRGRETMIPFSDFRWHLNSLERRNGRLKLGRASLHADLLEQRSKRSGLSFQQLMQADFLLYARDYLDCSRTGRRRHWFPVTMIYAGRHHAPFEVFARSQSREYFEAMKQMFDIDTKDELQPFAEALKEQEGQLLGGNYHSINLSGLMGFDKMASLP